MTLSPSGRANLPGRSVINLKWKMRSGAEGQNGTVDTSLFRAVLYQLSYLGTVHDKKSEALLQDHQRKIKLPGYPLSERALEAGCGGEGGI